MDAVTLKRLVLAGTALSTLGSARLSIAQEETNAVPKKPCATCTAQQSKDPKVSSSDSASTEASTKVPATAIDCSFSTLEIKKQACCADGGDCTAGKCCEAGNCCESPKRVAVTSTIEKPSYLALFSDWMNGSPKLRAEIRIDLHASDESSGKGIGESVKVTGAVFQSKANEEGDLVIGLAPQTGKPMTFTSTLPSALGKIVDEVISCGHRICTGTKCYEIADEPVVGDDCSKQEKGKEEEEEPIMVVPAAPPAPPPVYVAQQPQPHEDPLASLLADTGLHEVSVPVPAKTVVRLLVERTELSTRLEMTEQLMSERQVAMEQIHALAERNARLSTQIAVAEARQQMAETLTAQLVERTESAVKLVAKEGKEQPANEVGRVIQSIQEDLSNIRRQIALLRRSSPVPFAPSNVGLSPYRPYVPTARVVTPPVSVEANPSQGDEKIER